MSKELDEIAVKVDAQISAHGGQGYPFIRAALDEAVAEERKALGEIVQRACYRHPLLRRRILAALDARSVAEPIKSERMPFDWKHTEKCLTGVSKEQCICWPPKPETGEGA
jgi:hypothetical protein